MNRVLILLLFSYPMFSQELIVNGDFEEYQRCPKVYVSDPNYQVFVGWKSLDGGTPDYYNTCGKGDVKVPLVWAGKQYPYNGNGFAGIYVWSKSGYREYITTDLNGQAIDGVVYEIRISFALASSSPFTCDWLGIRLLDKEARVVRTLLDFEIEGQDPQSGWVTALFQYKATGNEHSLTIGNFHANEELKLIDMNRTYVHPMLVDKAYFFIDGVSFIQPTEDEPFEHVVANIPVELEDVQFEFDKSVLMPSSFVLLDKLAKYIRLHNNQRFLIAGHTDNMGSRDYNQQLSEARANSVLSYLVGWGIESDRLTAVGRGNTDPVATNTTAAGREMNRRVTVTQISAH